MESLCRACKYAVSKLDNVLHYTPDIKKIVLIMTRNELVKSYN